MKKSVSSKKSLKIKKTRKVKVIAFGGGTGLSQLLKGLKTIDAFSITAVVTMADDGGSSGRLRKSMNIPPPGDLRNCLIALSDLEPLFKEVLQYRLQESELEGHSFGNLFLAVLTRITGNFQDAINEAHRLLQVQGRVLPSVLNKATLEALHVDGTKTTGQARISKTNQRIKSIRLLPRPEANPEVINAVNEADLILFGPGSLYTSVLVNLVPEKILESVIRSKAQKVYICNPMTQPGETNGFSVEDHVRAFDEICHKRIINTLIINNSQISSTILEKYRLTGAMPVEVLDMKKLKQEYKVICADLIEVDETIRHDAEKLGRILLDIVTDVS